MRSLCRSFIVACIAILCCASAVYAQPQVTIVSPGARELKRAAHRLRISAERLQNLRTLLREATDLARRSEVGPEIAALAHSWIELDRTHAVSNIELLYATLRNAAQNASDLRTYQASTQGAQGLLAGYARLDGDRALELSRQWPSPPESLGEAAARTHTNFETTLKQQSLHMLARQDPERALPLLEELDRAGGSNFGLRAQIAGQLFAAGKREQAGKLVDQVIAQFGERKPDARSFNEYSSFVQQLSTRIDPNRALEAFGVLARAAGSAPGPASQIRIAERHVDLTAGESAILNALRGFQGRPELALKALSQVPELKGKLDGVGGLDNALNPGAISGGASIVHRSPDGSSYVRREAASEEADLFSELRGKAQRDPEFVRKKLAEAGRDPSRVDSLIQLANRATFEDPDLALAALELARQLLDEVQPLGRRAAVLQTLVRAYRQAEGEVDPALLKQGFILAHEIREEARERSSGQLGPLQLESGAADALESVLIAEYAKDNFSAALTYAGNLADARLKLRVFLQMLQALRHPW